MTSTLWIILATLLFISFLWKFITGPKTGSTNKKGEEIDINALLERITRQRASVQADAFHSTISQLWNAYEREPAIQLIKEFCQRFSDTPIVQYWINQAITVEPELAQKSFDQEFLATHYRPAEAAHCGSGGCSCHH